MKNVKKWDQQDPKFLKREKMNKKDWWVPTN